MTPPCAMCSPPFELVGAVAAVLAAIMLASLWLGPPK